MAIYVDVQFTATPRNDQARRHGNQWCHLLCDENLDELHAFAKSIGLKREYFQRSVVPHYDLTPSKRAKAVKAGAVEKSHLDLNSLKRAWMKRWHGGQPDWDETVEGDRPK